MSYPISGYGSVNSQLPLTTSPASQSNALSSTSAANPMGSLSGPGGGAMSSLLNATGGNPNSNLTGLMSQILGLVMSMLNQLTSGGALNNSQSNPFNNNATAGSAGMPSSSPAPGVSPPAYGDNSSPAPGASPPAYGNNASPAPGASPSSSEKKYSPTPGASPSSADNNSSSASAPSPSPSGKDNNYANQSGGGQSNPSSAAPSQDGGTSSAAVDGGGPKKLILKNTDSKPMKIGLFENTGPGMNPNINDPKNVYTLQPGQTEVLSMPNSWQGRAQKLSGKADDPATWAELNFENKNGVNKTWYDESLIRGYNSAVTITDGNGNNVAGSDKSILSGAPAGTTVTDSGGNKVIDATEPYTGGVNQNVANYLDQAVGNTNAYVRNFDNGAVRTSDSNTLIVNFGAA